MTPLELISVGTMRKIDYRVRAVRALGNRAKSHSLEQSLLSAGKRVKFELVKTLRWRWDHSGNRPPRERWKRDRIFLEMSHQGGIVVMCLNPTEDDESGISSLEKLDRDSKWRWNR